jgi:hypothetical protein
LSLKSKNLLFLVFYSLVLALFIYFLGSHEPEYPYGVNSLSSFFKSLLDTVLGLFHFFLGWFLFCIAVLALCVFSFVKNKKQISFSNNSFFIKTFSSIIAILFGFYLMVLGVLSGKNSFSIVFGFILAGLISVLAFYSRGHQKIILIALVFAIGVSNVLFIFDFHVIRFIFELL